MPDLGLPPACAAPALEIASERIAGTFAIDSGSAKEGKTPTLFLEMKLHAQGEPPVQLHMTLSRPIKRPWRDAEWKSEFAIGTPRGRPDDPNAPRAAEVHLKAGEAGLMSGASGTVRLTQRGAVGAWVCGELDLTSRQGTIKGTWVAKNDGEI